MKKFLFCAAALFAAISFSACSDSEDDGPNINTAKLLGKWVALARYDYVAESDSYVEFNDYMIIRIVSVNLFNITRMF